ncbi:hypothetical protein BDF22DRAFT_745009 [Syncephalis plumigaleata]|nr:hypothetical protein BDF22DRAFT_745009 [Syncephalis plumigaleata]
MKGEKVIKNIAKIEHSMAQCSVQAAKYGQCIVNTYQNIQRDACKAEFQLFKECMRRSLGRK